MTLAERVLAGDPRAVARAISLIEDEDPAAADLVRAIFGRTGRAYFIGVTGPPGAGKSTLVDRMVAVYRNPGLGDVGARDASTPLEAGAGSSKAGRERAGESGAAVPPRGGRKVGVIAVDPTSPFSGGAVLGDRLRMQSHAQDADVFIRSMATRGHLGGLARATADAALVLDAAGSEIVVIETVGVGQDEVDIVRTADVSIVTLVPGTGDEVQALKAGIMEIADIFVVNKADRDGAHALMAEIRFSVHLHYTGGAGPRDVDWETPVLAAQAANDVGIAPLMDAIKRHRAVLIEAGALDKRRQARRRAELEALLVEELTAQVMARVHADPELARTLGAVSEGALDPYSAVSRILSTTLKHP